MSSFPNGAIVRGINTDDDLRRAKDFVSHAESIGMLSPAHPQPRAGARPQAARKGPLRPFYKAIKPYLAEKVKDDQNDPQTLRDKEAPTPSSLCSSTSPTCR